MTVGGLNAAKTYDGLGRISGISVGTGSAIQSGSFGFDAVGNLTSRSDTSNGILSAGFTYDALNRLTDWTGDFAGSARYDAAGNLIWKTSVSGCTGAPGITPCYTYAPGTHRLTSAGTTAYAYESGNGNINSIGGGSKTLTGYTAFNLPTTAVSGANRVDWLYDGGHNRVREVSNAHGTTYFMGGYERVERDRTTLALADSASPYTGCLEERTYLGSPEGTVGVVTRKTGCASGNSGTSLGDPAYWHKDHLGSLVATSNAAGTATARFRFDPWGARQCATLNASGTATGWIACSAASNEERGFTGHEMLDELGLVHMNGRLYDQSAGRFLQADPIVQSAYDGQNYNRYSYVMNNPLSYTDPTGFSWWTKWRAPIIAIVASVVTAGAASWAMTALADYAVAWEGAAMLTQVAENGNLILSSAGNAVSAAAGGFAAGGISGGNLQSAVQGAITATLTFGVGELSGAHAGGMSAGQKLGQVAGHAAVGCASAAAAGGSCKAGALAQGFSALAGHIPGVSDTGLLGRMAVGALASKVGGGKAENGALSAAFEYLFNECRHGMCGYNKNEATAGNGYNGVSNGYTGHFISDPALEGVHPEYLLGGGLGAYTAARAFLRTPYGAELEAAGLIGGARKIWDNLSFDGPNAGLAHANGRIFQVRWKNNEWGMRLDLHPMKGDPTNTPVLHLNIGPMGRAETAHIPIFDPKWFGWTR